MSTDLARHILHDGIITEVEYRELKQAQVDCLSDLGYEATLDGSTLIVDSHGGGAEPTGDDADEPISAGRDSAIEQCDLDSRAVEPVYLAMTTNPDNENISELVAQCLVRHELREPGYTAHDYEEEMNAQMSTGTLPEGFDTDIAMECQTNPQN